MVSTQIADKIVALKGWTIRITSYEEDGMQKFQFDALENVAQHKIPRSASSVLEV